MPVSRPRIFIKICGITCSEDAEAAVAAGADALGFVFHPESPRFVPVEQAARIARERPPFVGAWAVVRNPEPALLEEIRDCMRFDLVQFHGEESPELCARSRMRYVKAVPMAEKNTFGEHLRLYPQAKGFLLDGHAPGTAGGKGIAFEWKRPDTRDPRPVILAGGLTADNVSSACRQMQPWGVDVSTGVETDPGHKDPEMMRAFVEAVDRAR